MSEEEFNQALLDHEAQGASMFSIFAVQILDEIRHRYGPVADVDVWFNRELIR